MTAAAQLMAAWGAAVRPTIVPRRGDTVEYERVPGQRARGVVQGFTEDRAEVWLEDDGTITGSRFVVVRLAALTVIRKGRV